MRTWSRRLRLFAPAARRALLARSAAFALCLSFLSVASAGGDGRDAVDDAIALMRTGDRRSRVMAIRASAEHDDPRIVTALVSLLGDEAFAVRGAVIETLGRLPSDVSLSALRREAAGKADATLRGMAMRSLARLGDADSIDVMVAALASEPPHSSAVSGALEALEILRAPRTFDAVATRYAARPEDPYVHPHAGRALVAIDARRAVPFLLDRFGAADDGELASVATALSRCRDPRIGDALLPRLGGDAGLRDDGASENRDGDGGVRRRTAIRILAAVGEPRVLRALIEHADLKPADRESVALWIHDDAGDVVGPALVRWLRVTDEDGVVAAMAHALGRLKIVAAIEPLDEIARVRRADAGLVRVLEALAALGDRRAIAAVAARLGDSAHVPQPGLISSIRGFPENVRVDEVAAWSLVTLRDGAPPCAASRLSRFHDPGTPDDVQAIVADARSWWDAHATDPRYHLD